MVIPLESFDNLLILRIYFFDLIRTNWSLYMAQDTQTAQQGLSIDDTLNKSDFGHFVNENKKPILISFAIAVVLVIAISFIKYQKDQSHTKRLNDVYSLNQTIFTPFLDGKLKTDEYISKFNTISDDLLAVETIVPLIMQSADKLAQENQLEAATTQLRKVVKSIGEKHNLAFFMQVQLAALYEDLGKFDEALKTYETLATSSTKGDMQGKIYLDLARMYQKNSMTDKAIQNYEFVISNYKDTEYARLAKLYLEKMK